MQSVEAALNKQGAAVLSFTDYAYLVRELKKIDPTLLSGMKREFKTIAKPMQKTVQRSIPASAPISGMKPAVVPGRLTWSSNVQNGKKPPRSVMITNYRGMRSKQDRAITRVEVKNAGVVMADMAGTSNKYTGKKKMSREYLYAYPGGQFIGVRRHRLNGQGQAMIRALKGRGSRYAWKGADASRPAVQAATVSVLQKYYDIINVRMLMASGK